MRTLIILLFASSLGAQGFKPDCRLARQSSDNFTGTPDGTIRARRYELHAISIGTSVVTSYAIHKVFRTSPIRSTVAGGVLTGVGPHVRGLLMHKYPLDMPDVIADATMRLLPVLPVEARRERTADAWSAAGWLSAVGYLAVACFARP